MSFKLIPEMFLQSVDKYKDKIAYYEKKEGQWVGLTFKEIGNQVELFSAGLASLGVKKDSKVAILSGNCPRWGISDYALAGLGAGSVTVYPTLISPQIKYIIEDSDAEFIITQNSEQTDKILTFIQDCPNLRGIITMDDTNDSENRIQGFKDVQDAGEQYIKSTGFSYAESTRHINPDDLLTLIYTSGTTGNPKGVILTHKNLCSNIISAHVAMPMVSDDVFLSFLPLSHSFERMTGHFSGFANGGTTYFAESVESVAADMLDVSPTITIAVPRLYEKIYAKVLDKVSKDPALRQKIFWWAINVGKEASKYLRRSQTVPGILGLKFKLADKLVYSKLKSRVGGKLRLFISGGAPLSKEIGEFFMAAGLPIIEGYGLTETSPVITCNRLELIKFGTVGKAIDGVEVKIAKDGEILCRGDNVMTGYYNNKAATSEAIDSEGWFYTGDIGEFDEDNYLKITDRKKSLLVTAGGKNVAPTPLELALTGNKFIEQCLVLGDRRKFISALIVPAFDILLEWAQKNDITIKDKKALVKNKTVLEFYDQEIEKVMSNFSHYERVKKVALLGQEWTIKSGEMTPKLSIKRKVVEKNFAHVIEEIYNV
ncbi:MAG: long-chain fatty acid--CoA ligase [Candidatus Neomarinimicrobiota bacterium]